MAMVLMLFFGMVVIGAVQVVVLLVPTDGMFGPTEPASGGYLDAAIDVVIIVLVANGMRRGRRWAWVVSIVLASLNVLTGALVLAVIIVASEAQLEAVIDAETELAMTSAVMWLLMLSPL